MRNRIDMSSMFVGTSNLREVTLGEVFVFTNMSNLPLLPGDSENQWTGYWQNVGSGTVEDPQGEFVFSSVQLRSHTRTTPTADTWVWQPVRN